MRPETCPSQGISPLRPSGASLKSESGLEMHTGTNRWRGYFRPFVEDEPIMVKPLDYVHQGIKARWLNQVGVGPQFVGPVDICIFFRGSQHHYRQTFQSGLLPEPQQHL